MTGQSSIAARPFAFDRHFDDDGAAFVPSPRARRTYHAHEVDALVAQARAEGQAAQRAADEGVRAQALAEIAACARDGLFALDACIGAHRKLSADLAFEAARAIASAALEAHPQAPIRAALEALSGELADAPRLVIRSAHIDPELESVVEDAARSAGFAGQIALRPGDVTGVAFAIEWADGRADYDPEAVALRVREALDTGLNIDPDHSTLTTPYGEP